MFKRSTLSMFVLALPVALACSSDSPEGGGGLDAALGAQMSELSDLGDRFVGANEATYDTLGDASSLIGDALEGGLSAASTLPKQAGCLPESLAGATLLVDVQSNTFTPGAPSGLPDAVQFRLLSDPQTEVGYVNISCAGVLPSISVTVSVNTTDDVEVLNLTASQIFVTPPSSFSASTITGTLRSAAGDTVPLGTFDFDSNTSFSVDEFSLFASTSFLVGETITASVNQEVFGDPSFASEIIRLVVTDARDFDIEFNCPSPFNYRASMQGTPGNVLGGGVFCARPPLGDDFAYHVNCDEGSVENMVVSPANLECQANAEFSGDATQLSGGAIQAIQEGTTALLGMHNAVVAVVQAGAAVALELAEAAQQQQQF